MSRTVAAAVFAAVLFPAAGCGQPADRPVKDRAPGDAIKDRLVGKWVLVKSPEKLPAGTTARLEFRADGTFTRTLAGPGKERAAEGTWKVDGTALTLERTVGITTEVTRLTVVELTGDTLRCTDDGKEVELTRAKAEK